MATVREVEFCSEHLETVRTDDEVGKAVSISSSPPNN